VRLRLEDSKSEAARVDRWRKIDETYESNAIVVMPGSPNEACRRCFGKIDTPAR